MAPTRTRCVADADFITRTSCVADVDYLPTSSCALCPGAVDWHNCGRVLDVWEFGWDWFMYSYLLYVQYCGHWGPLYYSFCNGPTSWQCSQGYLFDFVVDHVIFSLGLFSASISAQCTGQRRTARRWV